MATKKPHEGNVNVQGDFEIIVTRAMPSLVWCDMPPKQEIFLFQHV
jgi:hypothetical protein